MPGSPSGLFSLDDVLKLLAVITGLVGTPAFILFMQLIKRIEYLETRLDRALGVLEGQTEVSKELVETTKARRPRPRT